MRLKLLIITLCVANHVLAQSFQKIHSAAIVVDTHNDILIPIIEQGAAIDEDLKGRTHSDLARWRQGGLDVQFFSIWCDGKQANPFMYAMREMDSIDAVAKRSPAEMKQVANSKQMLKAVKQHKLAAFFGVEGGHFIEDDLNKLDSLFRRGARYMTLTWNNSTAWATSAFDETFSKDLKHKGLTDFGRQVVNRMNGLGMMVDISHVGEQTFWDVINTTTKPIIASHSSVYNLCHHQRNLKDDQIKAIAKNGGVVQINFFPGFLDSAYQVKYEVFMKQHKPESDSLIAAGRREDLIEGDLFTKYNDEVQSLRAPFNLLIEHIQYIVNLVGADYVGLGSDFDGISIPPLQMDDVSTYPLITKALVEKGFSKKDINKILGGNIIRVLKANESKEPR